MGHHSSCTDWDYKYHPDRGTITRRCRRLAKLVQKRPSRFDRYGFDTRPGHRFMFFGMAPASCPELAGNYRGLPNSPLSHYQVGIAGDTDVGIPANFVSIAMSVFEKHCSELTEAYLAAISDTNPAPKQRVLIARLVQLLCTLLEEFFRIHPYANGNGHAGRMMLLFMMIRQGFNPVRWSIDESPTYSEAIKAYRRGKKAGLHNFVMRAIVGP